MRNIEKRIFMQLGNSLLIGTLALNLLISCTNKTQQPGMDLPLSMQPAQEYNTPPQWSKRRHTTLLKAVKLGKLEAVEKLLKDNSQININHRDERGFTALLWAAYNVNTDMIQLLLMHNAIYNYDTYYTKNINSTQE